tara:strand:- start:123 stop:446 length:324 start_codon:yes stop_codon:yes gene_type:complete
MDKFEKLISKHENYTTLISVVNLVCEISEKGSDGQDKLRYAIQMFHVVAKELKSQNKIPDDLYEQCEKLTEEEVESYINDAIELWNRIVPLFKRIKRILKSLKCCKK